jgi:hypothetical protein
MSRYGIFEEGQRNLFLENANNSDEKLYREVPVFCRSVDLVIFNTAANTITAVEFKLGDWKRAVNQVLTVAICFDFIEVCVPLPRTAKGKESILEYCCELGVGVYFFDRATQQFSHTLSPKKVQKVWEVQRTQVMNYLAEEQY